MVLRVGKKFSSATAFSIACKRQQTPGKQGDDGWKSVLYDGQPLEHFRKLSQKGEVPQRAGNAEESGSEVRCLA